jgi:hypothetical protein
MSRTFTAAAKEYFGYKPGQTLTEFGQELKALSYEEKMDLAKEMRKIGIDCDDPTAPK